jgi:uroporphyrinogen decarboxylase
MTHLERFMATIERRPVDYPASWLGLPDTAAIPALFSHFGVTSMEALKAKINDDVYAVEMPYHSPTSNAIYTAFDFAKDKHNRDVRTLTAPGFFEDSSDPSDVDKFAWPDPVKYIDPALCRKIVDDVPKRDYAVLGVLWSSNFQDACSAFGMEAALIKMLAEPEMFKAVIDRITAFYLRANEIFFEATKGKLHAVLVGNDFGSQYGLMVSPEMLRDYGFESSRKIIQQAKSYGLKVIYHSCGSVHDVVTDLISLGADAVHPIQALAANMEPERLRKDFSDIASFCGGVDAQYLMVKGTPDQVREKVRELKQLFPTGLIISPSHEAILPDTIPANVEVLFDEVHQY